MTDGDHPRGSTVKQLEGRRIIVTGAARGIGAATARAYAREGARVAALDVLDDLGQKLAGSVDGHIDYHHCDIANRQEVIDVFARVTDGFGGLDVLANVAGIERRAAAEAITEEGLDAMLSVHVKGTVFTNQAAFAHLKDHGGRIINFGSDAGLREYPGGAHYSAAKGAIMAWTRSVAHEWGPVGVTVNSLVPAIWTPMYDEHRARLSAQELAEHDRWMASRIPIGGRLGDPDTDLAPVMIFLAGDGARFINGQIISVNGGSVQVR
jgi:NAD(P)-dependent dehydrogenase (short-subunit alcohol dehydrogenase family)